MKIKELTTSIIGILIVLGAIASWFFEVGVEARTIVNLFGGLVIGYYFKKGELPIMSAFKKE